MGQYDTQADHQSFETRELAWELEQSNPDAQRIKFLIDSEADVKAALSLAHIHQEKDLLKKPALRHLQLHRYLRTPELVSASTA